MLVMRSPIATGTVSYYAPPRERMVRLLRAVGEQPVRVQEQGGAEDLWHNCPVTVGGSIGKPPCGTSIQQFYRTGIQLSAASVLESPCRCYAETADIFLSTPASCALKKP